MYNEHLIFVFNIVIYRRIIDYTLYIIYTSRERERERERVTDHVLLVNFGVKVLYTDHYIYV